MRALLLLASLVALASSSGVGTVLAQDDNVQEAEAADENQSNLVQPEQAVEDAPGISYWAVFLVVSLAVGAVIFYVVIRQDRERPPGPGHP